MDICLNEDYGNRHDILVIDSTSKIKFSNILKFIDKH